jgi:hypothetical protein
VARRSRGVHDEGMFEIESLRRAVEIQQRSYGLLRWAVDAVDRGVALFHQAHTFATFDEAALAWIRRHYDELPSSARPSREDLPDFARFFSSYVDSSFDLDDSPGQRLYSPDAHCFCPMCSWLVDAPRLRPKKLTAADKKRARSLELGALHAVAAEAGTSLSPEDAARFLEDPTLREALALVAYGRDLGDRLRGVIVGPATLALWRTFAWNREGSPKKGFRLTAEAILDAEQSVRKRLES